MSFLYVALGDSLSVGVGTTFFSPGFVQRFRRSAERVLDDHIALRIYAHSGYKTEDVLNDLKKEYIQDSLRNADIITITAGGNDLISAARKYLDDKNEEDLSIALKKCITNMTAILDTIHKLKSDSDTPYIIRMFNLYNPFPKEPLAQKWVKKFDTHLNNLAIHEHVAFVDMQKLFKNNESEYLSIDQIHPNDLGYDRMAEQLNKLGYGQLGNYEEE
ncbi:MAG: GDSL-type esterase/lipase family protein [Bacillota bacterium]|nr:GDSL-type esterase/lipase family protein [Bacillota bacterium]